MLSEPNGSLFFIPFCESDSKFFSIVENFPALNAIQKSLFKGWMWSATLDTFSKDGKVVKLQEV